MGLGSNLYLRRKLSSISVKVIPIRLSRSAFSRIRLPLEIPLQSLFESPTIADMASVITAHQGNTLDEQGLATLLNELESLSDEEAQRLVGEQRNENSEE